MLNASVCITVRTAHSTSISWRQSIKPRAWQAGFSRPSAQNQCSPNGRPWCNFCWTTAVNYGHLTRQETYSSWRWFWGHSSGRYMGWESLTTGTDSRRWICTPSSDKGTGTRPFTYERYWRAKYLSSLPMYCSHKPIKDWDANAKSSLPTRATESKILMAWTSVTYEGPRIFNTLPEEVQNITGCTVWKFNSVLDKFLWTVPDQAPVPDYTARGCTSNALLDQVSLKPGTIGLVAAMDHHDCEACTSKLHKVSH